MHKTISIIRRPIEYLLFWSASVSLLAYHFAIGATLERIDVWFSLLFHLSIGFVVALNSFVWIPTLLARRRHVRYFAAITITLLVGVWLNHVTFNTLAGWLFPDFFFISYLRFPEIAAYLTVYTLLTTLIQFSRSWFREADMQRELMVLQHHQQEQELQLLQQQVQPHFLFNSLNSIYALVRKQSDRAEDAVLQLSGLLRYTIAHAGKHAVPLDQELDYIKSYIALQQLRLEPEARVFVDLSPEDEISRRWQIVPLMLINLVENAFKHAAPVSDQMVIDVTLELTPEKLIFSVSNTVDGNHQHGMALPFASSSTQQGTGTGMLHLRKRLEYYYKDSYELNVAHTATHYTVTLEIKGGTL